MKHTLLVLIAGLLAGSATHLGWFKLHEPCGGGQLECQLDWMRTELRLNETQFLRIREIHEASSSRLLALAAEVARMRDEYQAFERERTTEGKVDFVEFARFVEQRRAIDRECLNSTRKLVSATCDAMDPVQRTRYLGLLHPVIAGPGTTAPQ